MKLDAEAISVTVGSESRVTNMLHFEQLEKVQINGEHTVLPAVNISIASYACPGYTDNGIFSPKEEYATCRRQNQNNNTITGLVTLNGRTALVFIEGMSYRHYT